MEAQRIWIIKAVPNNPNTAGATTSPDFKLYQSAVVAKATIPSNQRNEACTSLRVHLTPRRMVRIKETRQVLARMLEIGHPNIPAGGNANWCSPL